MVDQRPKVGVGIFIIKNGRVLLGKRKNAHGDGTWAPPGGHLEFGETLEQCADREVKEETGLTIKNIRPGSFTNDIFEKENKHYITIYMLADYVKGVEQVLEPDRCIEWKWFTWGDFPEPLFLCFQNLLLCLNNPLYPGAKLFKELNKATQELQPKEVSAQQLSNQ